MGGGIGAAPADCASTLQEDKYIVVAIVFLQAQHIVQLNPPPIPSPIMDALPSIWSKYKKKVSDIPFPWGPIPQTSLDTKAPGEADKSSIQTSPSKAFQKAGKGSADKRLGEKRERFVGRVIKNETNFGFIELEDGSTVYFNQGQVKKDTALSFGDNVSFFLGKNHKGDVAKSIVLLSNSTGSKRKARAMRTQVQARQEDVGKRRKATGEKNLKCKKTNL